MPLLMIYDTETTGLPDWRSPSDAPHQPHPVQLAALLADTDSREVVEETNLIVRPDGWTIPDEVSALHGITTERALAEGIPEGLVVNEYVRFHDRALAGISAYGISFDERIMRIAMLRDGLSRADIEAREARPKFCVMRACTPICKLPPTDAMMATGRRTFKTPKLEEAIRHFFDEGLDGAHDAMVDVRATLRLYWHLKDMEKATLV